MTDSAQDVLDPRQLKLMQSTHRGFLYQHLYGVAVLLASGDSGIESLLPERDEDQELVFPQKRLYLQIKTRNRPLIQSDIEGALDRFAKIRTEHVEGRRLGNPEFWVISNVGPAESLKKDIQSWPSDVFFKSPEWASAESSVLPPAWPDLDTAIAWCIERAGKVPFPSLSPSTTVWKLAGMIQASSAGTNRISFSADQLPIILEQLVVQLQKFPQIPLQYRPHETEPPFDTDRRMRLLIGFSGSGKTTWAAQGSQHSASAVAYFDVGDVPASGIAGQLAREVAAILSVGSGDQVRKVMLPGTGGLQLLVALDEILASKSIELTIVLDNAHRTNATDISAILTALHSAKWIVLGQPWPGSAALEARFGISAESMSGWSILAIGAAFSEQGAGIDPELAEEFRQLTGGLPLYVQSAARIAGTAYRGDARKLCEQLKSLTHTKTTGQEEILNEVQKHLSKTAADVSAILSLSNVSLTQDETWVLINAGLGLSTQQTAAAIRELRSWGIVDQLLNGELVMHDSFQLVARQRRLQLNESQVMSARCALIPILMQPHAGAARARLLFNLLPAVGKTDSLIEIASGNSELLHELGMAVDVEAMIREAISNPDLTTEDRFWAVQTLLFWDIQNGQAKAAEQHYEDLLEFRATNLTLQQQQALGLMEVLMCGMRRDRNAAKIAVKKAQQLADDHPDFDRVLKYNYALTLFQCDDLEGANRILERLAEGYLRLLDLEPSDFIGRNIPEIAPKLGTDPAILEDAKRFADVLTLLARIALRRHQIPAIISINAFKFYVLSQSYKSAVKWMQDVVDQLLALGQLADARQFLEGTLPIFKEGYALDYLVPVYSQYAVVLARCGEIGQARRTMTDLEPFLEKSSKWRDEVENQKKLVELIAQALPESGRSS
jgi:hypothetical protein